MLIVCSKGGAPNFIYGRSDKNSIQMLPISPGIRGSWDIFLWLRELLGSVKSKFHFDIEGTRSRVRYKQNSTRNIATSIHFTRFEIVCYSLPLLWRISTQIKQNNMVIRPTGRQGIHWGSNVLFFTKKLYFFLKISHSIQQVVETLNNLWSV